MHHITKSTTFVVFEPKCPFSHACSEHRLSPQHTLHFYLLTRSTQQKHANSPDRAAPPPHVIALFYSFYLAPNLLQIMPAVCHIPLSSLPHSPALCQPSPQPPTATESTNHLCHFTAVLLKNYTLRVRCERLATYR